MKSFFESIVQAFRLGTKLDDNLYIKQLSRDEFILISGDHQLKVQTELLSGKPDRVVYINSNKKWLAPYDKELIQEEKYEYFLSKIKEYFTEHRKEKIVFE